MDNSTNDSDQQKPQSSTPSMTNMMAKSSNNPPTATSSSDTPSNTNEPPVVEEEVEEAPILDNITETPSPEPVETITPMQEEPLIDLPRPRPQIEASETDGEVTSPISESTPPPAEEIEVEAPMTHTATPDVTAPEEKPEVETAPVVSAPDPVPATLPAKPPKKGRNMPAMVAIIAVVLLFVAAGLAFLFVQNSRLKGQIRTIEDINSQRALPSLTPTASPSAMAMEKENSVFSNIEAVIAKAQTESPTAQLLMVTVENQRLNTAKGSTASYWFRTGPNTGQYFQIAKPYGGDYEIIKPASVSPDNNIPDLLESQKANTIGIDDLQVIKLGWEKVAKQFSQGSEPKNISLIYIKANPSNPNITTPINLWQVTYYFPEEAGTEDVIIQVDANTQNIVFTNKNIAVPTNEVTPTATQSANVSS